MARNLNGWIRIDRSLLSSRIYKRSPETTQVWMALLLMANYEDSKEYLTGSVVKVKRGELVTGILALKSLANVSEAKVKSALKWLEDNGKITQTIMPKGRVISITSWDSYQADHGNIAEESLEDHRKIAGQSLEDRRKITARSPLQNKEQETSNKEPVTINNEPEPVKKETREPEKILSEILTDSAPPEKVAKPKKPKPEVSTETTQLRKSTRESYADAMGERWKVEVKFNATINSQIAGLVQRLGKDAPEVIRFYVMHNDIFYVKKCHPVGACLKDAESLYTQWQRKQPITSAMARNFEKRENYQDQMRELENIK